ncbi:MAG: hypothetical protein EXR43_00040 [Dehalococcoidia bacterium]|nr:hypothetical protein [Dehalococcoidia bacterium]
MMPDSTIAITQAVLRALEGGEAVATATVIARPEGAAGPDVSARLLVRAEGEGLGSLGGGPLEDGARAAALEALRDRISHTVWLHPDGTPAQRADPSAYQVLIEAIAAPETLLIVGGGHIGLSLATIGEHLGFSVAVIDERPEYASPERFPMADQAICGEFDEEVRRFPIGADTYVVIVTRGHRQDETALREAVGRGARYVGMIGSRRRVGAVLRHLVADGVPPYELERVHTPIGLDIGAETPAEIAVSIIAEIIQLQRGGSGRPMRERRAKLPTADADAVADAE